MCKPEFYFIFSFAGQWDCWIWWCFKKKFLIILVIRRLAGSHKIEVKNSKEFRILFSLFNFLEKNISTVFSRKFQERSVLGWGRVYVPVPGQTPPVRPVVSQLLPFFVPAAICSFVPFFVRVAFFFFVLFPRFSSPLPTSRPQFSELASPEFRVLRLFRCAFKLRILPCKIRNGLVSYTQLLLCTKEDGLQSKPPRPRDHDVVFCCVLPALTIFVVVFVSAVSFRNWKWE